MISLSSDPVTSPFNNWLKANGVYLAIGAAILIVLILFILLMINFSKKGKQLEEAEKKLVKASIAEFLGGKENILSSSKNGSRIVLELKDYSKVDETKLKENGVLSIIKMSNKITLVLNKSDVDSIFASLN